MQSVLVVVAIRLGDSRFCLLVVGTIMRPDVLPLEGVVERLDVTILLRGVYPGVFHLDSQKGDGPSEVLAGVLGSAVALESQVHAVGLATATASTIDSMAILLVAMVSNL